MKLTLQKAKSQDISELCKLVNLAYRGEHGWTKETHLVAGDRATPEEVQGYLLNPEVDLFITRNNNKAIACICIETKKIVPILVFLRYTQVYKVLEQENKF